MYLPVFPECCGTRWGDSRLPEEHHPLHFRASAQVPRRFSQGGGAEAGSVVRLISLPDCVHSLQGWEQAPVIRCLGLASIYHNLCSVFLMTSIGMQPKRATQSLQVTWGATISMATPQLAFSCLWVSAAWSPLMMLCFIWHTHTHTDTLVLTQTHTDRQTDRGQWGVNPVKMLQFTATYCRWLF